MPTKSLAPQQERSRQTLNCLLNATIAVLDKHGLDGATVPRIAKEAKVAPASVYRRFADKDALVRAAILHVLESSAVVVQQSFTKDRFENRNVKDAVPALVRVIFRQYREHPTLLQAIKRFSDNDSNKDFERSMNAVFADNFRAMTSALSVCKGLDKIKEKDKRIQFALMTIVTAIEVMIIEPTSLWNVLWTENDEKTQDRLVEMFFAYVGVK